MTTTTRPSTPSSVIPSVPDNATPVRRGVRERCHRASPEPPPIAGNRRSSIRAGPAGTRRSVRWRGRSGRVQEAMSSACTPPSISIKAHLVGVEPVTLTRMHDQMPDHVVTVDVDRQQLQPEAVPRHAAAEQQRERTHTDRCFDRSGSMPGIHRQTLDAVEAVDVIADHGRRRCRRSERSRRLIRLDRLAMGSQGGSTRSSSRP